MADAATTDITDVSVDDLNLPTETITHILTMDVLEADDVAIVYAVQPDAGTGRAEVVSVGDGYRVTFEHHPPNPDAVSKVERAWSDTLGGAVDQLADWMLGVNTEDFLDKGGDVDG